MPRIVSLAVLLVLIITLGSTFFRVVAPFLLPLFLAVMTAIVCQPVFHYFLRRTGDRPGWAAGLTTFSIMSALLVPIIVGILFASMQLYVLAHTVVDTQEWHRIFSQIGEAQAANFENLNPMGTGTAADEAAPEPAVEAVTDAVPATEAATEPPTAEITSDPASSPTEAGAKVGNEELVAAATEVAAAEDVAADAAAEAAGQMPPPQYASFGKWFDDLVEFGNQFLPQSQRKSSEAVAQDLRVNIREYVVQLGNRSLGLAGTTVGILAATAGTITSLILSFAIYAIALYFFLSDGTAILEGVEKLIPVHAEYKREIMREFAKVVRSVVLATFFAAIAQGLATGIALWFFGFPNILVLTVLATLGALVPLVGTPIVWFPCVVILAVNGHPIQAVILFLYGAAFVGFLDNVIRAYVLNTEMKLHPLLAFVSVIGGLQAMGLWGVFIGPIVASCLHALVKIFNHELMVLSRERMATAVADTLAQQPGKAPRRYSGTDSLTTEMLREIARSAEQSGVSPKPAAPPSDRKPPLGED